MILLVVSPMLLRILLVLFVFLVVSFFWVAIGGRSAQAKKESAAVSEKEITEEKAEQPEDKYEILETPEGLKEVTIIDDEPDYMDYEPPMEDVEQPSEGVFDQHYWEQWDRENFTEDTSAVVARHREELISGGLASEKTIDSIIKQGDKKELQKEVSAKEEKTKKNYVSVFQEDFKILPFTDMVINY